MFSCLRKRFGRGNVDCGETRVKESGLSSLSNDGQRQHFWGMWNAGRETSSPETALSEKQAKKEKERLIKELQLITKERNDLRYRLRFLTERSKNNRPHFRPNPYYEDLERMEEVVMSILHNLEMENTEIHENSHKLKKEITFSRNLLSQLLMENTCRKKLVPQMQGSKEGHLDCALNQKYLVDFNKKDKDQQRPDPASSGLRKCKRAGIGHTPVRELPEE
ncbi:disks large homolog 5-like [Rattus norvegicus]|nr:disks large homolog 5-like isoform X1 [Rattus norvegicus]XP_038954028.1 disks large homolog 5-like isoform X1 [Rattus norvegicus]